MAYCHGSDSPYGCGHHTQHSAAARLGWRRRKLGRAQEGQHDARHFELATGTRVSMAHTHASHRGRIVFKNERNGKWYELPRKEWRDLVKLGKAQERDERVNAKVRDIIAKDATRQARHAVRVREAQERQLRGMARAEYNDVARTVKRIGGINDKSLRAEVRAIIPSSLRARRGKGVSLDRARESIMEHMPWLNLSTESDVLDFFDRARTRRNRLAHNRRHAA